MTGASREAAVAWLRLKGEVLYEAKSIRGLTYRFQIHPDELPFGQLRLAVHIKQPGLLSNWLAVSWIELWDLFQELGVSNTDDTLTDGEALFLTLERLYAMEHSE